MVKLKNLVRLNKLVVLHGKSGLGKSSLINAGLVPELKREREYNIIFLRFTAYSPDKTKALQPRLVQLLKKQVRNLHNSVFLDSLTNKADLPSKAGLDSLVEDPWVLIKQIQYQSSPNSRLLIIFDQFEEIFTYPDEDIAELVNELASIQYSKFPESIQHFLRRVKRENQRSPQDQKILSFLNAVPAVKFLISIRSDKLSFLDRLIFKIPSILSNLYELRPLKLGDAEEAIMIPAQLEAEEVGVEFNKKPFLIGEGLVQEIMKFLTQGGEGKIETFLLQLICHHIEEQAKDEPESWSIIHRQDIGDLDSISREYYEKVLGLKPGSSIKPEDYTIDALNSRHLIENVLVNIDKRYRLSVDQNRLFELGFSKELLSKLVDDRIIRGEPNTVESTSYELSHDTLIDGIFLFISREGSIDDALKGYYTYHSADDKKQAFLESLLDTDGVNSSETKTSSELEKELIDKGILERISEREKSITTLFLPIARDERDKRLEAKRLAQKRQNRLFKWGVVVIAIAAIIGFSLYGVYKGQRDDLKLITDSLTKVNELLDTARSNAEQRVAQLTQLGIIKDSLRDSLISQATILLSQAATLEVQKSALEDKNDSIINVNRRNEILEAQRAKTDSIKYLTNIIPYLEFPDDSKLATATELASMISSFRELTFGQDENLEIIKKGYEGIMALNPEVLLIPGFGTRVTSLNTAKGQIYATTLNSIRAYRDSTITGQVTFPEGFKCEACIPINNESKLVCRSSGSARLIIASTSNLSLLSPPIPLTDSTHYLVNFKATRQKLYTLLDNGDLWRYDLDSNSIGFDVNSKELIPGNYHDITTDGPEQLIMLNENGLNLLTDFSRNPEIIKKASSTADYSLFDRVFQIESERFLITMKDSLALEIKNLEQAITYNNTGYISGVVPGQYNYFGIYSVNEAQLFNRVINFNDPLINYLDNQGISSMIFNPGDSLFYIGNNTGKITSVPIYLNQVQKYLSKAIKSQEQ